MNTERNSSRGRQQGSKKPGSNRKTFESRGPNSKAVPKRRAEKLQTKTPVQKQLKTDADGIRLNKYISNSGICSRREADV
ncbi:MAG: pseudouridine synthase, partial [Flavicella sp.]|nr:pseudouridine synthase [Flavicella sp.]